MQHNLMYDVQPENVNKPDFCPDAILFYKPIRVRVF